MVNIKILLCPLTRYYVRYLTNLTTLNRAISILPGQLNFPNTITLSSKGLLNRTDDNKVVFTRADEQIIRINTSNVNRYLSVICISSFYATPKMENVHRNGERLARPDDASLLWSQSYQ